MELRKLYGDLSDREKQIANDHFLYLTQLDYIDFSSKYLFSFIIFIFPTKGFINVLTTLKNHFLFGLIFFLFI